MKPNQQLFDLRFATRPVGNRLEEDCEKIREYLLSNHRITASNYQAFEMWEWYSDKRDAQWLSVDEDSIKEMIEEWFQ